MNEDKCRHRRQLVVGRGFARSRHEIDVGAAAYELVVPIRARRCWAISTPPGELEVNRLRFEEPLRRLA
jgi:hypothetical protein